MTDQKVFILTCLFVSISSLTYAELDSLYQTTFIIRSFPSKTPHDAKIFIAGEFAAWYPDVDRCEFEKQSSGEYRLVLHHNRKAFEYKITRGSWDSVEGRSNGRARTNRKYSIEKHGFEVTMDVRSWEDLSHGSYHTLIYILAVAALQIVLLVVAINTIRNKNKSANGALSALLILIALALIGRASTYDPDIFNWQPKLLLLPETILFTYAPLFYIYVHLLLKIDLPYRKFWWLHFLPTTLHVLVYVPYIIMDNQTFIYRVLDTDLFPVFATSGSIAFIYNSIYWRLCFKAVKHYSKAEKDNKSYQKYLQFLRVVIHIKAGYLIIWAFAFLNYGFGWVFNMFTLPITEFSIDLLWVLFSLIIFCIGYYAMKQPELFKEEKKEVKYKDSVLSQEEFDKVKTRLAYLMTSDNVYVNPELTLPDLAIMIPTTHHTLSRVINEGFNQTFSQYINEKRVNAFLEQLQNGEKEESMLRMALNVGFNSKATFNRAFKKFTGTNPRDYLKEHKLKVS